MTDDEIVNCRAYAVAALRECADLVERDRLLEAEEVYRRKFTRAMLPLFEAMMRRRKARAL